jgi:xeroderma pigmentosum group C-complementing protein
LSAFAKHHLYVLEKHFGKYRVIHPPDTKPVGFFKAMPVYLRKNLSSLHTAERWLQEGSQVKEGEKPARKMKKRLVGKKRSMVDEQTQLALDENIDDEDFDVEGKEDLVSEYFGPWQVEPYYPGEAMEGMVPKNRYGNVWLYKPEMLPKGCAHVQLENLMKIARKLGLDCAPAMVGWEHGRYPRPVLSGFVVCEEDVETLTEAWAEDYRAQIQKEEIARKELIANNWKRLFKGVLIRERLEKEHGPIEKDPTQEKQKPKAKVETVASAKTKADNKVQRKVETDSSSRHQHDFIKISEDEKRGTMTRRCSCGLTITSENLML